MVGVAALPIKCRVQVYKVSQNKYIWQNMAISKYVIYNDNFGYCYENWQKVNVKVTDVKTILPHFGYFRTVTPVYIYRWLINDVQTLE